MLQDKALDFDALKEGGRYQTALFGGGCFWCIQGPFDVLDGVQLCLPGYSGGMTINPDYQSVCSGQSGHVEVMLVLYDPQKVSYEQLLDIFWRNIDPTQVNGQFADHGSQYKTIIYYSDQAQKEIAFQSRDALAASGRFDQPIATEIAPQTSFYVAEEHHQDYYKKNPLGYKAFHHQSGRAAFIKAAWSDT